MALSGIISQIKRDIGRKSPFFHTPHDSVPPVGSPHQNIVIPFGTDKLEWCSYPTVMICLAILKEFRHVSDGQADRRSSCDSIVHAIVKNCR